jgi:hypothetical protein
LCWINQPAIIFAGKDEEDYQERIREGGIQDRWMQGIEQFIASVFERKKQAELSIRWLMVTMATSPDRGSPELLERWQVI